MFKDTTEGWACGGDTLLVERADLVTEILRSVLVSVKLRLEVLPPGGLDSQWPVIQAYKRRQRSLSEIEPRESAWNT